MIEKEVWRTSDDGMAQDGRRGVCGLSRAQQSCRGGRAGSSLCRPAAKSHSDHLIYAFVAKELKKDFGEFDKIRSNQL